MTEALALCEELGVVHADLKADNIIVDYNEETQKINSLKIIDFGSAFILREDGSGMRGQKEFAMSTPEYLPPEIQMFMARRFTQQVNYNIEDFSQLSYVFDMWSLGAIILELLSGFPLWLSLKSKIASSSKPIINYGLFGVQGRDNAKILAKQQQLLGSGIGHLKQVLKKGYDGTNALLDDSLFCDMIGKMLDFDVDRRISP